MGAARECDDFHIVVLFNYVEYKKHKNSRSISSKMPLNIRLLLFKKISSLGWSPWHEMHSCNHDLTLP